MAVTLVDRNVYSTFQPLLYQVATAGLTSSDVAYPLWSVTRKTGARFHKGELAEVDADGQKVRLDDGTRAGLRLPDPGHRGQRELLRHPRRRQAQHEHVHPAGRGRACASGCWTSWSSAAGAATSADLNITIAGGGATGVELAGTLAELRNIALPASFPAIDPARPCTSR